MSKWRIILGIIFYIIGGFSTCLIVQIHDSNACDSDGHLEPDDIFGITALWPMLVGCIILGVVIPKLFMDMYKLFVLIIFLIGALFTKGDKNG